MSLLAHAGAGLINTWGLAYAGGIIGLFSVALLYVNAKVTDGADGADGASKRSGLVALGPGVIVVGGVCGVSLGLGAAGVLERQFFDDVDVSAVVSRLCDPAFDPAVTDEALHDDIEHAIDDLDADAARAPHVELHDDGLSPTDRDTLIDRLVSELTASDGNGISSCEALSGSRTGDES